MKHSIKNSLLLALWLTFSLAVAHLWVTNPDVFPSLPLPVWNWLDSYYGSSNAEEVADLEFLVIFTISATVVFFCFFVVYVVQRRFRTNDRQPNGEGGCAKNGDFS